MALKSDTAAEKAKDQLWRDFPGRSIFDFCNNIATFRTSRDIWLESVMPSKADTPRLLILSGSDRTAFDYG